MPVQKWHGRHEGYDVQIAANAIGFMSQPIVFRKAPIPDRRLTKSDDSLDRAWIFSLKIVRKHAANRAAGRMPSDCNAFALFNQRQ
ncbi:Uncharacterised protein [Vibrio cholerae]|nr:Uncharacterised protein [Vibrio cholerae]CSB23201.1 Uncharacterised protein [Vibrio cholerae]CSB39722.1 Uncharacterised protein [Vibrio cholerae]CSC57328.1 Uncharacterised protein [Vibrio cholerae]CSC75802.1 Uncharacterised protein [Vibrio cholerae]